MFLPFYFSASVVSLLNNFKKKFEKNKTNKKSSPTVKRRVYDAYPNMEINIFLPFFLTKWYDDNIPMTENGAKWVKIRYYTYYLSQRSRTLTSLPCYVFENSTCRYLLIIDFPQINNTLKKSQFNLQVRHQLISIKKT